MKGPDIGVGGNAAANANSREAMTLAAIQRNPWKTVDLALPQETDRTFLRAVSFCAGQCEKRAFAEARVAAIAETTREFAAYLEARGAAAAVRHAEAERRLAALAPGQAAKVSPFLLPARVELKAQGGLYSPLAPGQAAKVSPFLLPARVELKAQGGLYAGARAHGLGWGRTRHEWISVEAIEENRWNVLWLALGKDASRSLVQRVRATVRAVYWDAFDLRDVSVTAAERRLWDQLTALGKIRFDGAVSRSLELDGRPPPACDGSDAARCSDDIKDAGAWMLSDSEPRAGIPLTHELRHGDTGLRYARTDKPGPSVTRAEPELAQADPKLPEALRHAEFSRASIEADPWTAVYLEIPKDADRWLLMKAIDAASQCRDRIERDPGSGPPLRQGDRRPADHARHAADRFYELSHCLEVLRRTAPEVVLIDLLRLPGVKTWLLSRFHPDKHPNASRAEREALTAVFEKIVRAYQFVERAP
jgi:hypothetical protein